MLICLSVSNVALIEKLNIEWNDKMTVLTGETGAGKSVIIDCVNLLLGARSDKNLIRYGTEKARIQGMFTVSKEVLQKLKEEGIDADGDTVIVDREISQEGRNICRINGIMTTQNVLRDIGTSLINIHGQHDNQALLNPEKHIDFLDAYAKIDLEEYRNLYYKRKEILKEIELLSQNEQDKLAKIDLLNYQINEITSADLKVGEEEDLKEQKALIENSEKIAVSLNEAYSYLYGENCAYDGIARAVSSLEKVSGIDKDIDETLSKITDVKYIIEDGVHEIGRFLENIDFDENALNDVEERLDLISKLEKKYGENVEAILKFLESATNELEKIENSEEKILELQKDLENAEKELSKVADEISNKRKCAAESLQKDIENTLSELDMPKVKFFVKLKEQSDFTVKGKETAEFLICPNVGEELKPLVKIASGGELSRVMLAIKSIVSDGVDTMVFDEIDTGVSGSAAQKIAIKLSKLAQNKQVICISHSPQLAAIADNHYVISKSSDETRTVTSVQKLSADERVMEIARIIDGTNITETAIKHAREMLGK